MKKLALIMIVALTVLVKADSDPSPRMIYLGSEKLEGPDITGIPSRVFYYTDKATHREFVCFAGTMRETLSYLDTGRTR